MSISKLFSKVFNENIFTDQNSSVLPEENIVPVKPKDRQEKTLHEQMVLVKSWLSDKLNAIENDYSDAVHQQECDMRTRLGPALVILDIDFSSTVRISSDRLSVRSQGSFNTIKANTCVIEGCWMYEIQLHSKGIMQVGWCSNRCVFNENSGVGDSKLSYGYDGSKQQIWHISTSKYGEKWEIGDVIGVTIDVDKEEIFFYRNGKSMGRAFNKLEKGPNITFYPAISLGYNQSVQANFGNQPFKYPVEGFLPMMAKPIVDLQKSELLLSYLVNLSSVVSHYNQLKDKRTKSDHFSTKKTVYIVFGTLLIEKLNQMLFNPYIIEEKFLTCIDNLCNLKNEVNCVQAGKPESVLGSMLNLLWNYIETDEMRYIMKKVANALLSEFTHTHKNLIYDSQKRALRILIALCSHVQTRKSYLENKFFKKHFLALFMYIRPPEYSHMETLIPTHNIWTDGLGGPKQKYLSIVEKIFKATEFLYTLQQTLLLILLDNIDGNESSPSSRKIFLIKLRKYVMDLSMEQRPFHTFFFLQSSIFHPLDNTVALAFVCVLVDTTKTLFGTELSNEEVEIPSKYFFDGSFDYQHFDRVGGVLSHLRKVHRSDIVQQLGSDNTQEAINDDRVVLRVAELDPNLFLAADVSVVGRPGRYVEMLWTYLGKFNIWRLISLLFSLPTTFTTFLSPRITPVPEIPPNNCDTEASVCELLDLCILLYYSVGHKYIIKISSTRDEIAALNDAINETRYYRNDMTKKLHMNNNANNSKWSDIVLEIKTKFLQRENILTKRSVDLARKQAWFRAVALGQNRRLILAWLLDKTVRTLNVSNLKVSTSMFSSHQGALFTFIPEIYINVLPILLDTVMDFSNHDLMFQFDVHDSECVINNVADFLAIHSAESRIILASCKDSLLQALGTLTCHKSGIKALEMAPKKSQIALVKALLRPYENRAWGQSNWLLLRFWLGEGFAYKDARQPSVWQGGNTPFQYGLCRSRSKNESHTGLLHNIAPPNPSKLFQRLIGEKLTEDEPFATKFLNSVLGQLNWAFSEFILLLQEIQNTSLRQENTVFEPKQLKICSMCFELTVSLMRCLEMIITVAPDIFHNASRQNSDLILNRVFQLISQVLSRVTVPPGCFQFVVDMCSADLNAVTHFPIITAALGILLALLRPEMDNDKNPSKVTRITRALLTDPSFQFANLEFALGEIKTPILHQTEIPRGNFDPSTRAHIDPLTNDVRIPQPTSTKKIRADPPILKFTLYDFPTHITFEEIDEVRRLIDLLKAKQSLLSDITLPSEDSLCPICCAKPIAVIFTPCKHQSCNNCILQHLMNSKVCFYCKTLIQTIELPDGTVIYQNNEYITPPPIFDI